MTTSGRTDPRASTYPPRTRAVVCSCGRWPHGGGGIPTSRSSDAMHSHAWNMWESDTSNIAGLAEFVTRISPTSGHGVIYRRDQRSSIQQSMNPSPIGGWHGYASR
jgi:hypothetical protein